jgi:hypothetical protein
VTRKDAESSGARGRVDTRLRRAGATSHVGPAAADSKAPTVNGPAHPGRRNTARLRSTSVTRSPARTFAPSSGTASCRPVSTTTCHC